MRLIDADEIKYREQLEWFGNGRYEPVQFVYESDIDIQPTLDAAPIIRCKDCKYFKAHKGRYQAWRIVSSDGICKNHNYEAVRHNDYCSWAEREE